MSSVSRSYSIGIGGLGTGCLARRGNSGLSWLVTDIRESRTAVGSSRAGVVLPAYAGVIPSWLVPAGAAACAPHVRGDDPSFSPVFMRDVMLTHTPRYERRYLPQLELGAVGFGG